MNDPILVDNLIRSRRPGFSLSFAIGNGKMIDLPIIPITYIAADKDVSIFYFEGYDRKKISISQSISLCEQELAPYGFIRIHRTYIINLSFLKKLYRKEKSWVCQLFGGTELSVSRRKQKAFFEKLNQSQINRLSKKD